MHIRDANQLIKSVPIASREEVHLWGADLDAVAPCEGRWRPLLSSDESTRADRFRFAVDRQRFTATRAILRSILGSYLDCNPRSLIFAYSEHHKPRLALNSEIFFNVSHSGDVAWLAFTRGLEVGVDVERIRPQPDAESLAARFFSSSEQKELASYTQDQRQEAFFRCWTRKEAYIKARGAGLFLPLQDFDVSLAEGDINCLLATRPDPFDASRWSLRDIPAGAGYVGALCAEGRSWTLRDWRGNSQQSVKLT